MREILMLRILSLMYLLLFVFYTFSCSREVLKDNSGSTNQNTATSAEAEHARDVVNQTTPPVKNGTPGNATGQVVFDGKNYIKKSGWRIPSHIDTYVGEHQWNGKPRDYLTKDGNTVKMIGRQFVYRHPRQISEDFHFDGSGLDYIKGTLEWHGFFEDVANGKILMYTVYIQKVQPATTSNSAREGPSSYQIMDTNGDGIFETLLGSQKEIVIPDWVLD